MKLKSNPKTSTKLKENDKGKSSLYSNQKENNELEQEVEVEMDNLEIDTTVKSSKKQSHKLIIILKHASLELSKSKHHPEILNSDDHLKQIHQMKKTAEDYRPDITHQCLLSLFDSPLNKTGMLQVYIHTSNNILIEINPICRIPRTFKRFSGLFSQLLLKSKIQAPGSNEILLKLVNGGIKSIIPKCIPLIELNENSRLINIDEYGKSISRKSKSVAYLIGAMSKGEMMNEEKDDSVSLSSYGLTASVVCSRVVNAYENIWNIL